MTKKFFALVVLSFTCLSCNVYESLDKPHTDPQYLIAARACLDKGDYDGAKQNYQALSASYADTKLSELGLTELARDHIFSISDLVASLGSDLGSAASFSFLANTLAQRGITSGVYRTRLKTIYDQDAQITEPNLRAFSRFIAALGMFNEVLANAVGADGQLTASDFVQASKVSACKSGPACNANCVAPTGTGLTYDATDSASMATVGSNWSGPATIQKLIDSATAAANSLASFAGASSDQGLLNVLNEVKGIPGGDACARYYLIDLLGL